MNAKLRPSCGPISALVAALSLGFLPAGVAAESNQPPPPCGTVPAQRQLKWHELELYGFIHFTVNTFTDKEWGYGDESPGLFNPTALDARQWARVARDGGLKGLILTAKHHDGFCLWPSRYTEHSVKHSPWKNGQGDVVRELSEACRAQGLKFGVYLSPWDRNHADYGKSEYVTYYRNQLRELLTAYGPVFEVWFDGANGGDGYYGGAREKRHIESRTYYQWDTLHQLVRGLQPDAVMFSDAGPDVRWVGNESGVGFETAWLPLNRRETYPGDPGYVKKLARGQPDGTDWVPPEVDVSIRPGWFYHPSEDDKVKTAAQLLEIYYKSVGRSASLLLNLPPDRRGLIPDRDAANLRELRQTLDAIFKTDLALKARAAAPAARGNRFAAGKVNDGNPESYWALADGQTNGSVELSFAAPIRCDHVVLQEYIALGQRIEAWTLEAQTDGQWKQVASGTTVGYKRITRFPPVTTGRVRLNIVQARACPTLSTFSLYAGPNTN